MKTDTDNSKEISIREIELFFAKHGIKLESHESVPVFQGSNDETFLKLNQ